MKKNFYYIKVPWLNIRIPWFNFCPTVSGLITWGTDLEPSHPPIENLQILAERIVRDQVVETRCFNVTEHIEHIHITPELPPITRRWMDYKTDCLTSGTWRIFPVDSDGCPIYLGEPSLYYFESSFARPDKNNANFAITHLLSQWLDSHQAVKESIQWLVPGRSWLGYDEWCDEWKCELMKSMVVQHEGYSLVGSEPLAENQGEHHDFDQARALHFSGIAQTLLTEILGRVPWSLEELSIREHEVLFEPFYDKSVYKCLPEGFRVSSEQLPEDCESIGMIRPRTSPTLRLQAAPGPLAWKFLLSNHLIGETRLETIINLLKWGRHHLRHFISLPPGITSDYEFYWGYSSDPLAIQIMKGTNPTLPTSLEVEDIYPYANWTQGCTTTTYLLKQILSIVHIPISIALPRGHHAPHFIHEELYLAHADDIYAMEVETDYPAEELFISSEQYGNWFENEEEVPSVSVRQKQLMVEHLGLSLLISYCRDERLGRSHAEGKVYERVSEAYSLEELEAMDLWARMDDKINDLGGCERLEEIYAEQTEDFWKIEPSPMLS